MKRHAAGPVSESLDSCTNHPRSLMMQSCPGPSPAAADRQLSQSTSPADFLALSNSLPPYKAVISTLLTSSVCRHPAERWADVRHGGPQREPGRHHSPLRPTQGGGAGCGGCPPTARPHVPSRDRRQRPHCTRHSVAPCHQPGHGRMPAHRQGRPH